MKAIINLAICGMLALAVNANAASVQLAANSAEALQGSAIAQKWASEQLGVKAGASIAELNAAISKRSQAEQTAVINAINSFASNAIAGNADTKARLKNENLAKLVFTTSNGQMLAVGAMVQNAAGRENITNAAAAPSCSAPNIANDIYEKIKTIAPDVSLADVTAVVTGGYINLGGCGKPVTSISAEPLANLVRIAKVEMGCLSGQKAVGNPKRVECLTQAHSKVLGLDAVAAADNVTKLEECHYSN